MNYILKNSDQRTFFSPAILSGRVLEMIASVCGSLGITLLETTGKDVDSRVLVAKSYIEDHKDQVISCEAVARECCLSLKQLNRIFRMETGSSVFEYITATRVRYARKLLLQGERSIKEIAFLMGFENESSFVSFFKRHCGMPPGIYRKEKAGEE